jgi:hypothetical protein
VQRLQEDGGGGVGESEVGGGNEGARVPVQFSEKAPRRLEPELRRSQGRALGRLTTDDFRNNNYKGRGEK